MTTVASAKARLAGLPQPKYERPADWLPHFIAVIVDSQPEPELVRGVDYCGCDRIPEHQLAFGYVCEYCYDTDLAEHY